MLTSCWVVSIEELIHLTIYTTVCSVRDFCIVQETLLLHRYEINKIEAKLKEKGLTLVPLKVYFKDSLVKIEIGMARGKKLYDKRQDIAKKDQRREAERDFKVKNLY